MSAPESQRGHAEAHSGSTETKQVLFVADQFANSTRDDWSKYPGGAELTDEAVIAKSPWPVERAEIEGLDPAQFQNYDLLILGNLERSTKEQRKEITRLGRHILFEHDYRCCHTRGDFRLLKGPNRWAHQKWQRCFCSQSVWGDVFASALGAIFLTHRQLAVFKGNPRLTLPFHRVLGCSVMNDAFFDLVDAHREKPREKKNEAAVVFSKHHVKGFEPALKYCEEKDWPALTIKNQTPEQVLQSLAESKRLIYLPQWMEPAGRLAVEARLFDCEVLSNENLGVAGESWWGAPDEVALPILRDAGARFWRYCEEAIRAKARP